MGNTTRPDRYHELAAKWLNKTITPAEEREFAAWYNAGQNDPLKIPADFAANDAELKARIFAEIMRSVKAERRSGRSLPVLWHYAAAILLLAGLSVATLLYINKGRQKTLVAKQVKPHLLKNDVLPGVNKAVLTLANGSKIILNTAKAGVLASQGKTVLNKGNNNVLIYQAPKNAAIAREKPAYNTIATPKGGEFQIVLPDGSKVWLNAASSITFPTAFTGNERKVTITGEVYFEVAKNPGMPFRVASEKQTVEVLGTHFDVNAYADETHIKTTLAEGSIRLTANHKTAILKPDQQASIAADGLGNIKIREVDAAQVLAWTTGAFEFEGADIAQIMRQASRWYDVSITYEGSVPVKTFTGNISRNVNLSQLLNMLKYTGVNFKIQGKTIIVTP